MARSGGAALGLLVPAALFLPMLSGAATAAVPDGDRASWLMHSSQEATDWLSAFFDALAQTPAAISQAFAWGGDSSAWLLVLLTSAGLLAAAALLAFGARKAVAGMFAARAPKPLLWLVYTLTFLLVGVGLHLLLPTTTRVRSIAFAVFLIATVLAAISGIIAGVLRRRRSAERTPICVRAALSVAGIGYFLLILMRISGASLPSHAVVAAALWIVLAVLAVWCIHHLTRLHPPVANEQTGFDDPVYFLLSAHSRWFYYTVLTLITATTLFRIIRFEYLAFAEGTLALLTLGALPALVSLLPDHKTLSSDNGPWRATLIRCGRLVLLICFGLLLAWLLEINLMSMTSDRFGERAARILIDIGIAAALGFLFWQIASTFLNILMARPPIPDAAPHGHVHRASRIQTFVPLLRALVLCFILGATGMIILAAMGVDIGPLLAGAGIFGIAIGFGSQALVKDVISGLFYLSDDAFRIGEYIEIGSVKGTVEGISIRSLKLRHPRGALFTVPFGDIGIVNNQSRDFTIIKLEFLVDFDTDLRLAKKTVREISAEIAQEPELAEAMLEPLKFQGVRRMEPYGMVVGVKFTARPGQQFVVRRETYALIRDRFAKAGIRFARPEVRVGGGQAHDPDVLAAASTVIEGVVTPPKPK
ncbi:mechanosensitive ion channel family protein [Aureimonas fodinaquatilis]|nr:mechanosensitive ion channel family protein [Aureimonas fodinaquatilis]